MEKSEILRPYLKRQFGLRTAIAVIVGEVIAVGRFLTQARPSIARAIFHFARELSRTRLSARELSI